MNAIPDYPEWLGAPPEDVARSLRDFARSTDLLSNNPALVQRYAGKWVAVTAGQVKAAEDELDSLLAMLDHQGLSRSDTLVHFVETEPRTLIL